MVLIMSGQNMASLLLELLTDAACQLLLGNHEQGLGNSKQRDQTGWISSDTGELVLNCFNIQVRLWTKEVPNSWFIWKLIPVKVEGLFTASQPSPETHGSGSPPSYSGDATGQSSTRAQHVESERDDFGTIMTEVTTITTRKRYRVEDA